MKIRVTQEHIDKGERRHHCKCPVALAVKEAFPEADFSVTGYSITWFHKGLEETELPYNVADFISDFDNCWPVNPFEFELDI